MISCVHWKGPDENANDACSSVSAVAIKLLISFKRHGIEAEIFNRGWLDGSDESGEERSTG